MRSRLRALASGVLAVGGPVGAAVWQWTNVTRARVQPLSAPCEPMLVVNPHASIVLLAVLLSLPAIAAIIGPSNGTEMLLRTVRIVTAMGILAVTLFLLQFLNLQRCMVWEAPTYGSKASHRGR